MAESEQSATSTKVRISDTANNLVTLLLQNSDADMLGKLLLGKNNKHNKSSRAAVSDVIERGAREGGRLLVVHGREAAVQGPRSNVRTGFSP